MLIRQILFFIGLFGMSIGTNIHTRYDYMAQLGGDVYQECMNLNIPHLSPIALTNKQAECFSLERRLREIALSGGNLHGDKNFHNLSDIDQAIVSSASKTRLLLTIKTIVPKQNALREYKRIVSKAPYLTCIAKDKQTFTAEEQTDCGLFNGQNNGQFQNNPAPLNPHYWDNDCSNNPVPLNPRHWDSGYSSSNPAPLNPRYK